MPLPSELILRAIEKQDRPAILELGRLLDNLQGQVGTGIARRRLNSIATGILVPGLYAEYALSLRSPALPVSVYFDQISDMVANLVISSYQSGGDIVLRPDDSNDVRPYADDTYTLGDSNFRWTDIKLSKPTDFAFGRLVANRQALPGLRGLWNMNSSYVGNSATNLVLDESHNERDLTPNGTPTFGVQQVSGLPEVPYVNLASASAQYLSRADETALDITGSLTWMCWFYGTATPATNSRGIMSKFVSTGNQRSYAMDWLTTSLVRVLLSTDGINNTHAISHSTALSLNTWYFLAFRYIPSTSVDIWVNSTQETTTSSITASIFSSTAVFELGRLVATAGREVDGRIALASLHAAAVTDAAIAACYAQERGLFGV